MINMWYHLSDRFSAVWPCTGCSVFLKMLLYSVSHQLTESDGTHIYKYTYLYTFCLSITIAFLNISSFFLNDDVILPLILRNVAAGQA